MAVVVRRRFRARERRERRGGDDGGDGVLRDVRARVADRARDDRAWRCVTTRATNLVRG